MEKNSITCHKFLGENNGHYKYEITFNRSLEHTGRIHNGISLGLNRFDKWRWFWRLIHKIPDLLLDYTKAKWVKKFYHYTNNRF
jgi:hypothetical protein